MAAEKKFTKIAHRPWDKQLLQDIVDDDSAIDEFDDELVLAKDGIKKSSIVADPGMADNLSHATLKQQLESALQDKLQQQSLLQSEMITAGSSQISIGGFFQPSSTLFEAGHDHGQRVASLLSQLQEKKQKIEMLQGDIRITETMAKVNSLESQVRRSEVAKKEAEQKAVIALADMESNAQKLQEAEEQINQLNKLIDKTKCQSTDYEKIASKLNYEVEELRRENVGLKSHIKHEEERSQQALSQTLHVEMSQKKFAEEKDLEINALQDELTAARQAVDMADEARELEANYLAKEKQENAALLDAKNKLEKIIGELKTELATAEQAVKVADDARAVEADYYAREKQENELITTEKLAIEKTLTELKADHEATCQNMLLMQEKIDIEIESKRSLEAQLTQKDEAIASIEVNLRELQTSYREKELEIKKQNDFVLAQKQEITDLDTALVAANNSTREVESKLKKYEDLVKSEREMRKTAEQNMQSAIDNMNIVELEKKKAEQDRDIQAEKAKKAIEKASKAFMHFLESPQSNSEK